MSWTSESWINGLLSSWLHKELNKTRDASALTSKFMRTDERYGVAYKSGKKSRCVVAILRLVKVIVFAVRLRAHCRVMKPRWYTVARGVGRKKIRDFFSSELHGAGGGYEQGVLRAGPLKTRANENTALSGRRKYCAAIKLHIVNLQQYGVSPPPPRVSLFLSRGNSRGVIVS